MESILPSDDQILRFLLEVPPNPIMELWCRRQAQLYIDEIQTSENGSIIGDVIFGKIKPVNFKQADWATSDDNIMGLLPLSVTGKLERKTRASVCKLIRMVYFLEFFKATTTINEFTGKFNFISDTDAVKLFKKIFWSDGGTHDTKRRHT